MTTMRIAIERLSFGGNGVGRIDGMVCFVPFSCPGDELLVRVTTRKRSYLIADIVEILTPGPERVPPSCPLFGSCGGCSWQHVAYQRQLSEKGRIFADTFWRGARVPAERIEAVLPSPAAYGYRSRVQLKLHQRRGKLLIGFYRQGTHRVEDAPAGCPIALPVINTALGRLRQVLNAFPDAGMIPRITIDAAGQGVVAVVSYGGRDMAAAERFFLERQSALSPISGLYLQADTTAGLRKVWGDDCLAYSLADASGDAEPCLLSYRPGGFSQVNSAQNVLLLQLVRRFAALRGGEQLLDLYCGNGNFSLPLARSVAAVTGIEEYADSIAAARDNARRNGINNAEFICADAEAGVRQLADDGRCFDVVILDPPRSGAAGVVQQLGLLGPGRIIYISCDPSTLARDCGVLRESGYGVQASVPVDMFPQTYHLESVTLLMRENEDT